MAEPVQLFFNIIEETDNSQNLQNDEASILAERINRDIDRQLEEMRNSLKCCQDELSSVHRKMKRTMRQEDEFLLWGNREGTLDLFPSERCDFSTANINRIEAPVKSEIERLECKISELEGNREQIVRKKIETFISQGKLFEF